MSFEIVKSLMKEIGWGALATSDGKNVGVRPIGSWAWIGNELWCATRDYTDKITHLKAVPYAEYCFHDREGKHVRISGPCTISTNNDVKLKLYEAVPILKNYIKDPTAPEYVVIRMKPERIRLMIRPGLTYEDIAVTE